jgi:hypothetical protein
MSSRTGLKNRKTPTKTTGASAIHKRNCLKRTNRAYAIAASTNAPVVSATQTLSPAPSAFAKGGPAATPTSSATKITWTTRAALRDRIEISSSRPSIVRGIANTRTTTTRTMSFRPAPCATKNVALRPRTSSTGCATANELTPISSTARRSHGWLDRSQGKRRVPCRAPES